MHEAAIAQSIVRMVLDEAEKQNAARVESVEVEIGDLTFLGADQIAFWVETSFEGTVAEGAELIFRQIKGRLKCNDCGHEGDLQVKEDPTYHMKLPSFACAKCESTKVEITQGKEAFIRQIKILKE